MAMIMIMSWKEMMQLTWKKIARVFLQLLLLLKLLVPNSLAKKHPFSWSAFSWQGCVWLEGYLWDVVMMAVVVSCGLECVLNVEGSGESFDFFLRDPNDQHHEHQWQPTERRMVQKEISMMTSTSFAKMTLLLMMTACLFQRRKDTNKKRFCSWLIFCREKDPKEDMMSHRLCQKLDVAKRKADQESMRAKARKRK